MGPGQAGRFHQDQLEICFLTVKVGIEGDIDRLEQQNDRIAFDKNPMFPKLDPAKQTNPKKL